MQGLREGQVPAAHWRPQLHLQQRRPHRKRPGLATIGRTRDPPPPPPPHTHSFQCSGSGVSSGVLYSEPTTHGQIELSARGGERHAPPRPPQGGGRRTFRLARLQGGGLASNTTTSCRSPGMSHSQRRAPCRDHRSLDRRVRIVLQPTRHTRTVRSRYHAKLARTPRAYAKQASPTRPRPRPRRIMHKNIIMRKIESFTATLKLNHSSFTWQ